MGATKPNDYSELHKAIALGARALNHPCRVKIFGIIQENKNLRADDLQKMLKLSKSTTREHLQKLKDAGFVTIDFFQNSYLLNINNHSFEQFCKQIDALPQDQ